MAKKALLMAMVVSLALAACSDETPPSANTPAPGASIAAPAAATETPPTGQAPVTVAELLDSARLAMREQRLIQPVGNNAIEMYLKVLEQEPDNRQAQLAILELMPLAQGVAEQMIDSQRLDEAQQAIALLKRAQPDSVVVTTLEQRIVTERRAEAQRTQAEAEQLRLAEQRRVQEAQIAQQQAAAAPPPAEPRPAAQPVATTTVPPARESAPAPAPASPPATPSATPAAQLASAAPAPSVAASTAPQSRDFSLVRRVDPDYPSQALRTRTEGWVELSFTITASGDVEEVSVVNSNPRRIFDREAIRALSQWKFNPRTEGGRAVSTKARQRLEFSLD